MISKCRRPDGCSATAAVLILTLVAAGACTSTSRFSTMPSEQVEASPQPQSAPPPPPQPPPVDLAGRWRLSMVGGAACLMTFTASPGAGEGSIAPTGGCPANFF